jgi:hypothetical protein
MLPGHDAETERNLAYPLAKHTGPLAQPQIAKKQPPRLIVILLVFSSLFFLLASVLLALFFLNKPGSVINPSATASPNSGLRPHDTFTLSGKNFGVNHLLSFTRDNDLKIFNEQKQPLTTRSDAAGSFSVRVQVPEDWEPGSHKILVRDTDQTRSASTSITIQPFSDAAPSLKLSTAECTFGADASGVVSNKTITLVNEGGNQVNWKAESDQLWLLSSPPNGAFFGKQDVQITVNRGALAPGSYSGQITFTAGDKKEILKVTMGVNAGGAAISVSTTTLNFVGTTLQNPPAQVITLSNTSSQPLDWKAMLNTSDGNAWLAMSPTQGRLEAGASSNVNVTVVRSQNMGVGSYQGLISFEGGANAQVTVNSEFQAVGNLIASPAALTLDQKLGQSAVSQTVHLQNNGSRGLDWSGAIATDDQGSWISINPVRGRLEAGSQLDVTVGINGAALRPGTYRGNLTFSADTLRSKIPVTLTVTGPLLNVATNPLTFTTFAGKNPVSQQLVISNSGNAPLNWTTNVEGSPPFISVTPSQGTLAVGAQATLTIAPDLANTNASTTNGSVIISDKDTGGQQKKVPISMTVIDRADIKLSVNGMQFTNNSTNITNGDGLYIINNGSRVLHPVVTYSTDAPWLSIIGMGDVEAGSTHWITILCTSRSSSPPITNMTPGTYSVVLTIKDRDNPNVPTQTLTVTMVVK